MHHTQTAQQDAQQDAQPNTLLLFIEMAHCKSARYMYAFKPGVNLQLFQQISCLQLAVVGSSVVRLDEGCDRH